MDLTGSADRNAGPAGKPADAATARRRADTGTLGKAMDVLEIVSRSAGPMRFTDILAESGQPRGTLHRQLSNLVEEGLLSANPDHSYEIGLRLLQLSSKAWAGNDFRQIAEPHIRALQGRTGETVHLGILKGAAVIYLDKVESNQSVRMHSQIGNASPLYCTGVGKAALSAFSNEEIRDRMAEVEYRKFTASTLEGTEALLAEVAQIRASGIAWDREEHEVGIHCVAAPVHSANLHIAAGISVTAPAYRVTKEQLQEWAPDVAQTARNIMAEMSARLSPRH